MSKCIKCGTELEAGGLLCSKCRGNLDYPTAKPKTSQDSDINEISVDKLKELQEGDSEKPVKALKKKKKVASPSGEQSAKSRDDEAKEKYKELMEEFEKKKKDYEEEQRQKGVAAPQYQETPPQAPYSQQYDPNYQYYQGQPQQQGYPQQQPADYSNMRLCPRCGYPNDRWTLSCTACKANLG